MTMTSMKHLRAICLGAKDVGKTSLLRTMVDQRWHELAPTVGVDYCRVMCETVHFLTWDTAGNPKFRNVVNMFLRDCRVFLYIFDLTRKETLDDALLWHDKVLEMRLEHSSSHFLIGCKNDLDHDNEEIMGRVKQFAELNYYTVSAKNLRSTKQLWKAIEKNTAHIQPRTAFHVESKQEQRECCLCQ